MRSSIARWGAVCVFLAACLLHGGAAAAPIPVEPNDSGFPLQWNLQQIGAPAAWQRGTGAGITIAIVDSGVDLAHPDLKDKVIGHVTCVGSNGDESKCVDGGQDDNGHGTHVAGIAAADTNNGTGVAGVAPEAAILDVKVLSQSCDPVMGCDASGTSEDVAAGIRYAADHGASVINLSLGEQAQSLIGPSFESALQYAFNKEPDGAIPVLAAGNNFVLPSGGALDAIVVGALDKDRSKSSYSNNIGDAQWALMAPGGEPDTKESCTADPNGILSTYLNGYACLAGTSMAAPHVAGAAAILRSMGYSKKETIDRLLATAQKMEPSAVYGSGALDVSAAVGATSPASTSPTSSDSSATSAGPPSSTSLDSTASSDSASSSSSGPPAPAPAGDLSGPTSTAPAGVITLPNQRAAAPPGVVTVHTPDKKGDVSAGLVAAAVALAAGVSTAVLLLFLRSSNLRRRTPRAPES